VRTVEEQRNEGEFLVEVYDIKYCPPRNDKVNKWGGKKEWTEYHITPKSNSAMGVNATAYSVSPKDGVCVAVLVGTGDVVIMGRTGVMGRKKCPSFSRDIVVTGGWDYRKPKITFPGENTVLLTYSKYELEEDTSLEDVKFKVIDSRTIEWVLNNNQEIRNNSSVQGRVYPSTEGE
jgi:hypothetical protein